MSIIESAALVAYGTASLLLFAFGANLLWCSFVAWRRRATIDSFPNAPEPAADSAASAVEHLPNVTIQLPIFNEPQVARRVIEACAAIDYPADRLQIQVLDDSDDGSSASVAEVVADLARSSTGPPVEHRRRPNRNGYKAGALADGLETATGEIVAVFDADFVPPPDVLRRTVGAFADPEVAFVQGRWGHLNPTENLLTRLQVPAIDGHFLVEQQARGAGGHWFNFNGTAGLWRVSAIDDAGGWRADTLTEDLDLSYRAHLRGWRAVYRPDVLVPGELPASMSAFRRQQHRWARGSMEVARKLLRSVWRSPAPFATKLQASFHLLAYGVHLLLLTMVLTYPFVVAAADGGRIPSWAHWPAIAPNAMTLAPVVFLITGQAVQAGGLRGRRLAGAVAAAIVVGSGLMVNTARAVLDIALRPDPVFERTAKSGNADRPTAGGIPIPVAATVQNERTMPDPIVGIEAVVGLYSIGACWFALSRGAWGIAFYAGLFGLGLLTVAVTSASAGRRSAGRRLHNGRLRRRASAGAER
ncbi:MAG: glycosyltransferase [Actinomycetota bacterium]